MVHGQPASLSKEACLYVGADWLSPSLSQTVTRGQCNAQSCNRKGPERNNCNYSFITIHTTLCNWKRCGKKMQLNEPPGKTATQKGRFRSCDDCYLLQVSNRTCRILRLQHCSRFSADGFLFSASTVPQHGYRYCKTPALTA